MHLYVYQDRSKYPFPLAVLIAIAVVSIAFSLAINITIEDISYIQGPSALLFFGLLYKLFDSYLWRWQPLRTLGIVSMPNLQGEWNSSVISTLPEYPDPLQGSLRIHQTFSRLSITFNTKISRSRSLSAVIAPIDQTTVRLTYQFAAERDVVKPNELSDSERVRSDPRRWEDHEGTARVFFDLNAGRAQPQSGRYYTDSDQAARGDFHFERESTDLDSNNREG